MTMQRLAIEYFSGTHKRFAEKTAIVDGEERITFGELRRRSVYLGYWLRTTFDRAGTPVVISIPKSIPAVVAILGIQLSGNIYVPIDMDSPPARRKKMLDQLGPHLVLESSGNGFTCGERECRTEELAASVGLEKAEGVIAAGLERRTNFDPVYIIFTSGTTGTPKGVTITNAGVINYIDWAVDTYAVTGEEIICVQAPFFFDNSVLDIYLMLARGCTLHLLHRDHFIFLPTLAEYIGENKISFIFFVPSVLVSMARLDLFSHYDLSCLTKVLFAGEAMPLNTLCYLRKHLPRALLSNLYGPTEITVDCIYWIFGEELEHLENVPLGIPCRNAEIVLLDEHGSIVTEADTVAEICVGGIGVSPGYWNDPERTREAFIRHPARGAYRSIVYKTGDLGYISGKDNLIYMVGRKDHQIKHQGYRIEPGEIEAAFNRLEEITQSCAVYDETKKEILLYYTTFNRQPVEDAGRKARDYLPAYMMPRRLRHLERFPLTANGKIDRGALRSYVHSEDP